MRLPSLRVSGSASDLKNQLDFCSWNFAGAGNDPVQNLCPMTRIVIPNNTTLCSLHRLLKLPTKLERVTPAFLEMMLLEDIVREIAERTGEGEYCLAEASLASLVPD